MNKLQIHDNDRILFTALDKVRLQIQVLEDVVARFRNEERQMASLIFAKYGIPVNSKIDFRNWVVTHVGGKELPDPPAPSENSVLPESKGAIASENAENVK